MPNFQRIAHKIKVFFKRLTRRRRSRNRNLDSTRYQEGEAEGGSTPFIRDAFMKPPLPVAGDGATSVAHVGTSAVSAHSRFDPSASPSACSAPVRLQEPPSTPTPPPPLFAAEPTIHALQLPDQNARSLSSSRSSSNTAAHSPHALSATSTYFPNASGFNISQVGLSIGQVGTGNVQTFGVSKTVFEYLEPHVSHGAAHNSSERSDAPTCDPETRFAIQEDVVSWMRDGDEDEDPKQIMWLSGPAGSGKTAIAGSVAEICRKEGLLAATFFFSSFSGSVDRHSKRYVVATLALHLAGHHALHEYQVKLLASVERQPNVFQMPLSEQAHYLLIEPFRTLMERGDRLTWPKGIMLDGLDEVLAEKRPNRTPEDLERAHEDDQLEILNVLITLAEDPVFPFRIFVASRPERVIAEFFSNTASSTTVTLFLDWKYQPDVDIERFLWSKFAGIRRRHRIAVTSWPGQETVSRIVEMSSGQFIVPATIIRHIESGVPQRQLDDIMQLKWEDTGRSNPFAALDALYTYILGRSPEPFLAAKWISVYASAQVKTSALYFKRLVEDVEGEFDHVLRPLSSLISIPTAGDEEAPLKMYHKSLADYLSSKHRSGGFYVIPSLMQAFVADRCVRVLISKGPAVPIPYSANNIGQFLDVFYYSTLFNFLSMESRPLYVTRGRDRSPFPNLSNSFDECLVNLHKNSRAELALCDVAWWTRLCLAHSPYKTEHFGIAFLKGMYCGIHTSICDSQSPSTNCHAACSHWRMGILAEAKNHNWCVHELEQADLAELSEATDEYFDEKFKKMGEQKDGSFRACAICQPNVDTSVSLLG